MTNDERQMLTDLADKIAATPAPPRDPDAEQLIRTRIGSRPDALYLMTQTVLIQNMALQQAQQQIQQMRSQGGNQLSEGGSFLGQGSNNRPSAAQAPPQYQQTQYAAPASSAPNPSVLGASGAPSFFRGAAQTAAGVAAGALAFEGIQHLFSHPGYGGGGGGFFGGGGIGGYAPPVDETVVNNYYNNDQGNSDGGNYDDRGDNFGNTGQDDYQAADDASNAPDDTQYGDDNNGGFDNGGGYDDNSGGGDNFV